MVTFGPGEWPPDIVAVVTHAGFLPGESRVGAAWRTGAESAAVIEVRLERGRTLAGTLTDRLGTPLPGIRVLAVGIGYGRSDAASEFPSCRAYPGSGCGAADTDAQGRFEISAIGDEPCTLYLDGGWRFLAVPESRHARSARHPVVTPGSHPTLRVVREALVAFRVLDRERRRPVSGALQTLSLPRHVQLRERGSSTSLEDYGLQDFAALSYRGAGLYLFPVTMDTAVESVECTVTLKGYEPAPCTAAIVTGEMSPEDPVPTVTVKRESPEPLEPVSFIVPEDFPTRRFPGLPCFAYAIVDGARVAHSFYADREDGRRYTALLPVGDYDSLGIGKTRQARSGPFSVGIRGAPTLVLEREEARFARLVVEIRDEQKRPLRGCGVGLGENVGPRELRAVAGIECGSSDAWPIELLVPRAVFDRRDGEFWLSVWKPAFEETAVRVTFQPEGVDSAISVTMVKASE